MTASEGPSTPGGLVWFDEPAPRRAPEGLSRERIITAAVHAADQQPRGEITMRALAGVLGVRSPMALYRHVGSKDGLTDLMVDHIYAEITVPHHEDWRRTLQGLGESGWQAVQRHPWFARLAFSRPPFGPHALALYDSALAPLERFDLDAAARMGFVNTVLGQVLSSGLALLEEQAMRVRVGLPTEQDLDAAAAPYLRRITAEAKHPHFIRWANDPDRHRPPPQSFEQILEWLLDGLSTLLR